METIDIKTADLIEYDRNPRVNDHVVDKQAALIREYGFLVPILAKKDNTVIDGHLRLKAARKLKLETVPVVIVDHLTEQQISGLRIAINKSAELAGWDDELLSLELEQLSEAGFDMDLTGFDEAELSELLAGVEGAEFPVLNDGDKEPFQQVTFTLHDEQADILQDAISKAKKTGLIETGLNENSNGNAISYICEQWLNNGIG